MCLDQVTNDRTDRARAGLPGPRTNSARASWLHLARSEPTARAIVHAVNVKLRGGVTPLPAVRTFALRVSGWRFVIGAALVFKHPRQLRIRCGFFAVVAA